MRRMSWLRKLAPLAGCLMMGCLFYRPGELPPDWPTEGPADKIVLAQSADPTEPGPTPDFHVPPATPSQPEERKAASVEPILERVKLEVGPAPAPALPLPLVPAISDTKPPTPEAPLVAALRCAMEKHPDEAQRLVQKLDRADRDLLLNLIRLTAGIGEKELEKLSAKELASTLEQFRQILEQIRERAPLELDKVCFCRKIDGFGQYEAVSGHEFQAGSDGQPGERVQVYVEVRNFRCVAKQGKYETRLGSALEIRDEKGRKVVALTPEPSADLSQTPRQDYFLNFQFHVPAKLPVGRYDLRVTVKDLTPSASGKKVAREATQTLPFWVCPPGGRRGTP